MSHEMSYLTWALLHLNLLELQIVHSPPSCYYTVFLSARSLYRYVSCTVRLNKSYLKDVYSNPVVYCIVLCACLCPDTCRIPSINLKSINEKWNWTFVMQRTQYFSNCNYSLRHSPIFPVQSYQPYKNMSDLELMVE